MDETAPLADALAPLAFLLGTWEGEGVGGYPTITDFRYRERIVFAHIGKPFLAYAQQSWLADGRPSAVETGYWRPQPDGTVEALICRPTGISEIYLGTVESTRIELATDVVARTPTAKDVAALKRLYGLVEDELMYAVDMAAMGQPLQPHLSARLRRVGS